MNKIFSVLWCFIVLNVGITLSYLVNHDASVKDQNQLNQYDDLELDKNSSSTFLARKKRIRISRAVTAKKERKWDHGVIPYEIDSIFSGTHKALFKQAMRHWENYTCIKFVERDYKIHKDFIFFTSMKCGCCAHVGKRGGKQSISIGRNCEKFGIVVHELGHVIGFWHEHTRIDRDNHIAINKANILKGQEYNFNKLSENDFESLDLPYDYSSIMHYARNTFSKSLYLDTISPVGVFEDKKPEIGQRIRLSEGDIAQANLLYQCTSCGRTFQHKSGRIVSPSYESKKRVNETSMYEKCEWRVTSTYGERILLKINHLHLLSTLDCQRDYLEIRDGYWHKSPIIKKLCGDLTDIVIQAFSSRMLITYVNHNQQKGYKGFKADFKVLCGGSINLTDHRRIDSPNYPLQYLPDKECIWTITAPNNYHVALKFKLFELENHDNCLYDFVEIRDGDQPDSELIGIFCGYKLPPNIKTNSNKMFLKFVSDGSVQKVGFSAMLLKEYDECKSENHGCQHECINTLGSYECACNDGYQLQSNGKNCEDECGGVLEVSSKTRNMILSSPSFPEVYPTSKICNWEIVAPKNYNIFLTFKSFDLEGTKSYLTECSYDYITMYSKMSDNLLKKIGVYCGNEIPPVINSAKNILRLEFRSDDSVQHKGFEAEISLDVDECEINNGNCQHNCVNTFGSYTCTCQNGYTLNSDKHNCTETNCKHEVSNSYGVIYSPNYPNSYPRNTYCYWHITTVPGQRVTLNFLDFQLEEHQECIYDSLTVYDGVSQNSSTLGIYCGGNEPHRIIASTNHVFIVLRTDSGLQKKGFRMAYSTECGGYLRATNETKTFYSHSRFGSRPYKKNMYCNWRIQSDNEYSVRIKFQYFEIEYSDDCRYDYVEIFEENSLIQTSNYGKFCGNKKPSDIISYSDTILIKFKTDETTSLKGFLISYTQVIAETIKDNDLQATPFPGYMKNMYVERYAKPVR